jgi:hypothetical protein
MKVPEFHILDTRKEVKGALADEVKGDIPEDLDYRLSIVWSE